MFDIYSQNKRGRINSMCNNLLKKVASVIKTQCTQWVRIDSKTITKDNSLHSAVLVVTHAIYAKQVGEYLFEKLKLE